MFYKKAVFFYGFFLYVLTYSIEFPSGWLAIYAGAPAQHAAVMTATSSRATVAALPQAPLVHAASLALPASAASFRRTASTSWMASQVEYRTLVDPRGSKVAPGLGELSRTNVRTNFEVVRRTLFRQVRCPMRITCGWTTLYRATALTRTRHEGEQKRSHPMVNGN